MKPFDTDLKQWSAVVHSIGATASSGDYTQQVTRVPIPNTTVKLLGPMIVPTSAKVGYRRIHI